MKVVFFGTPDFAVNALDSIVGSSHTVLAVVTQPDKRVGRHSELQFSDVKKRAIMHDITVLQYEKVSSEGLDDLRKLNADIFVTCAFGQILSKELIDIPKYGVINVHASLLPKYRGASPIQHAILNGDKETGVTIMQTEVSLDSGDIILSEKIDILPDETADELFVRLSILGANLVVTALDKIEDGTATFTKQNHDEATFVKQIKKQDALIDFSKDPITLRNFVRGMQSWPCAFTYFNGKMLKIFRVNAVKCDNLQTEFGTVLTADKSGLTVSCNGGYIEVLELQLEGGKRMPASDFLLGRKIQVGTRLGI